MSATPWLATSFTARMHGKRVLTRRSKSQKGLDCLSGKVGDHIYLPSIYTMKIQVILKSSLAVFSLFLPSCATKTFTPEEVRAIPFGEVKGESWIGNPYNGESYWMSSPLVAGAIYRDTNAPFGTKRYYRVPLDLEQRLAIVNANDRARLAAEAKQRQQQQSFSAAGNPNNFPVFRAANSTGTSTTSPAANNLPVFRAANSAGASTTSPASHNLPVFRAANSSYSANAQTSSVRTFRVDDPGLLAIHGFGTQPGKWRTLNGMPGMRFRFALENGERKLGWENVKDGLVVSYGYRWGVEVENNTPYQYHIEFKLHVSTSNSTLVPAVVWTDIGIALPNEVTYLQFADTRLR